MSTSKGPLPPALHVTIVNVKHTVDIEHSLDHDTIEVMSRIEYVFRPWTACEDQK
jgi:hypothetical protein